MGINVMNHTITRAKQRFGWPPKKTIQTAKKELREYLNKNISVRKFDDQFKFGYGVAKWVVCRENGNYKIVTVTPRFR